MTIITIEGGLIQDIILSKDAKSEPFVVLDYDTEGSDPGDEENIDTVLDNEKAFVSLRTTDKNQELINRVSEILKDFENRNIQHKW